MDNKTKKHTKWAGKMALLFIIIAIIVFIVIFIFLMHGNTTSTGTFTTETAKSSINCEKKNTKYPFFEENNDDNIMTINAIFNNKLQSISLIYKEYYETYEQSNQSEAINHAALNHSFGNQFGADAFNAKYTVTNNYFSLSLYANQTELTDNAHKYFLIYDDKETIENLKNNYENQGFICKIKD